MKESELHALCVVGYGCGYGHGHILRMLGLQKNLKGYGIKLNIFKSFKDVNVPYQIIVLDKRNVSFPNKIIMNKKKILIAVDNLGLGRQQADIVWDTLPNMAMNTHELKTSLFRLLLPDYLTQKRSKAQQSSLRYLPRYQAHPKHILAGDKFKMVSLKSQMIYINQMMRRKQIYTYFGQSLFEAIYLGKEIKLYHISPYHRMLALWFVQKWSGLQKTNFHLDGKGMQRLAKLISNLSFGGSKPHCYEFSEKELII